MKINKFINIFTPLKLNKEVDNNLFDILLYINYSFFSCKSDSLLSFLNYYNKFNNFYNRKLPLYTKIKIKTKTRSTTIT